MTRYWHLAHADGREWTRAELDQLATDEFEEPTRCEGLFVDQWGRPLMCFGAMSSYAWLDDEEDMVVVWDE